MIEVEFSDVGSVRVGVLQILGGGVVPLSALLDELLVQALVLVLLLGALALVLGEVYRLVLREIADQVLVMPQTLL